MVSSSNNQEITRKNFIRAVEDHFTNNLKRPELLNRIGIKNIVPFNFINDKKIIKKITLNKLDRLFDYIYKKHNIKVILSNEELIMELISAYYDSKMEEGVL